MKNNDLIFKDLSYRMVGILFEVHNELGRYKNENQYADRFEQILKERGVEYLREYNIPLLLMVNKKIEIDPIL